MKNVMLYAVVILSVLIVALIAVKGNGPTGQVTGFCRDSDGGKNVNVAGNVKTPQMSGRASGVVKDSCVGGIKGKFVTEQYCDGLNRKNVVIDCVAQGYKGCEQGQCVR